MPSEKKRWRRPYELVIRMVDSEREIKLVGRRNVSAYEMRVENANIDFRLLHEIMKATYKELLDRVEQRRRPAVLAKYALYIYSILAGIPLYKVLKEVRYVKGTGEVRVLSTNAFVKSTYKIAPLFEEVLKKAYPQLFQRFSSSA